MPKPDKTSARWKDGTGPGERVPERISDFPFPSNIIDLALCMALLLVVACTAGYLAATYL